MMGLKRTSVALLLALLTLPVLGEEKRSIHVVFDFESEEIEDWYSKKFNDDLEKVKSEELIIAVRCADIFSALPDETESFKYWDFVPDLKEGFPQLRLTLNAHGTHKTNVQIRVQLIRYQHAAPIGTNWTGIVLGIRELNQYGGWPETANWRKEISRGLQRLLNGTDKVAGHKLDIHKKLKEYIPLGTDVEWKDSHADLVFPKSSEFHRLSNSLFKICCRKPDHAQNVKMFFDGRGDDASAVAALRIRTEFENRYDLSCFDPLDEDKRSEDRPDGMELYEDCAIFLKRLDPLGLW